MVDSPGLQMALYSGLQEIKFKVHVPTVGIRAILGLVQAGRGQRAVFMPDLLHGTGVDDERQCHWYDAELEEGWPLAEEDSFSEEEAWWRRYEKGKSFKSSDIRFG